MGPISTRRNEADQTDGNAVVLGNSRMRMSFVDATFDLSDLPLSKFGSRMFASTQNRRRGSFAQLVPSVFEIVKVRNILKIIRSIVGAAAVFVVDF